MSLHRGATACDWKWVRTGNWIHCRSEIDNPSKLGQKPALCVFALNGRGVPRGDELPAQARAEKWPKRADTAGSIGPRRSKCYERRKAATNRSCGL